MSTSFGAFHHEDYFDGYININKTQFHGGHFCLAKNYDTQTALALLSGFVRACARSSAGVCVCARLKFFAFF